MHMALPPRKSSNPSLYAPRSSRLFSLRRTRLKYVALGIVFIGAIFMLLSRSRSSPGLAAGAAPVVIVTVLDSASFSEWYIDDIKENRIAYAKRHGYDTFFPEASDYNLSGAPKSWAKVPAMRHAMTLWPYSTYFWHLDQSALIMNPDLTIDSIMNPKRMETLMIKDQPIVPPDSVIKTFTHLHGDQIDFALTQDRSGLAPGSFVLRQGDWAVFFLDTWFDPLYRSYNFQKAETHALEHIVQWHPTILSKLALIPQRIINSYSDALNSISTYTQGDFVVRFDGCEQGGERSCEKESEVYMKQWRNIRHATYAATKSPSGSDDLRPE